MSAFVPLFKVYVKLFSLRPAISCEPVTLYVAPSPFTKPSPPTVTPSFVRGVPSYSLVADADVRVTERLLIIILPDTYSLLIIFVTSVPSGAVTISSSPPHHL